MLTSLFIICMTNFNSIVGYFIFSDIEFMNIIKKHTRPNPGQNVKGGIVENEAALHASNVQLVCPDCGAQTRIGRRLLEDGRKVRICRKCDGVVDR